ncbi:TIGR00366 family protein [Lachnospiraceae bacterium 62-26]
MLEDKNNRSKKDFISILSDWSENYIPNAFPLVLILTVLVIIAARILTPSTVFSIMGNWYDGFWEMLLFTMQVCLLMFTGYMVSDARPVKRIFQKLSKLPKTKVQAVLFFLFFETVLYYLHFALGIAGAIFMGKTLIVEQKKKGIYLPVNLVVSIGCFCLIFQAGPTAGSPLLVASKGHFMEEVTGIIPISESMLSLPMICMNLTIAAALFLVCLWLVKRDIITEDEKKIVDSYAVEPIRESASDYRNFSEKMDHFPYAQMFLGVVGLGIFFIKAVENGVGAISLNSVNFLFLMLALVLHRDPTEIAKSARAATSSISGVILQYPFYAGIFGILNYSGLGAILIHAFVSITNPRFYTVVVFIFSGLLNMIVPSGGSQFIVEAPYIMPAAADMGVSLTYVLNAFTIGDLSTNLIQPFWAIPVLAAFKIRFKNIFPYCIIAFITSFIIICLYFLLWMY